MRTFRFALILTEEDGKLDALAADFETVTQATQAVLGRPDPETVRAHLGASLAHLGIVGGALGEFVRLADPDPPGPLDRATLRRIGDALELLARETTPLRPPADPL